jgi:hypothetical protein
MISSAEINDKVVFVDEELEGLIAFEVIGDEETILVIHNAYEDAVKVSLPEGLSFRLVVNGEEAGVEDIATYTDGEKIEVTANSTFVLYKNSLSASTYDFKLNSGISFGVIIGVISGVVVIAAGAVVYFVILKRK